MRALVTGGAGFIGSHLVDALVADGNHVVVLDDLSTGSRRTWRPRPSSSRATSPTSRRSPTSQRGCDVVFHLAARGSVQRSVEQPLATDKSNVSGTLNVLCAAHDAGVGRVVLSSSSSVYGGAGQRPTAGGPAAAPRSPYAVSKLAGEHYARVFAELHGLETVMLRYFNVFGPRQRADSQYAAVVPRFIDALRRGQPAEIHGDGQQSRDFTYVTDAVQANVRAAAAPAETCAGVPTTSPGASRTPCSSYLRPRPSCSGSTSSPRTSRSGGRHPPFAGLDRRRRQRPRLPPPVSLRDGLAETVAWWSQTVPTVERAVDVTELADGLLARLDQRPGARSSSSARATWGCRWRCGRPRWGSASSGSTPIRAGDGTAGRHVVRDDVADDELAAALEHGLPADRRPGRLARSTSP